MTDLERVDRHLGIVALTIRQLCTIAAGLIVRASFEIGAAESFILHVVDRLAVKCKVNLLAGHAKTNSVFVTQMIRVGEQVTVARIAIGDPNAGEAAIRQRTFDAKDRNIITGVMNLAGDHLRLATDR